MNEKISKQVTSRIVSIDAMRGFVIFLMALDHSRDFFGDLRISTEDPLTTNWAFFLTRIVTHLCAPTFVLLAGVSAWLYRERIQLRSQENSTWTSRIELFKFLLTRGLWLVLLEFTVIYFGLALSINVLPWMFLVIAAIGCSMIALSVISFLPERMVLCFGIMIVVGHNLLDGIESDWFGNAALFWQLLHDGGYNSAVHLEIGYPILPWIGVICLGFGLAPIFHIQSTDRVKAFLVLGAILSLSFFGLRAINGYGNGFQWEKVSSTVDGENSSENGAVKQTDVSRTAFSFLRTKKYPPSLAYLLMTLGPAFLMLALFEYLSQNNFLVRFFRVFGKVPLFFYVIHFYILHVSSIFVYWIVRGTPISPFQTVYSGRTDELPYGFQTLWQVYMAWALLILVLFPLCIWYGKVKRNSNNRIWSYL